MKTMCLFSGFFWGVILIVIGILIIIRVFLKVNIPFIRILFSLLLIYIGVRILMGGFRLKSAGNTVVFSESRIEVTELSNEYNIIFGKGDIDLSKASPEDKGRRVKINTIFGRGEVKINPEMPVKIEIDCAFAEAKTPDGNQTFLGKYIYKTEKYSDDVNYLFIEADVVFGSLEIFNK